MHFVAQGVSLSLIPGGGGGGGRVASYAWCDCMVFELFWPEEGYGF